MNSFPLQLNITALPRLLPFSVRHSDELPNTPPQASRLCWLLLPLDAERFQSSEDHKLVFQLCILTRSLNLSINDKLSTSDSCLPSPVGWFYSTAPEVSIYTVTGQVCWGVESGLPDPHLVCLEVKGATIPVSPGRKSGKDQPLLLLSCSVYKQVANAIVATWQRRLLC